MMFDADKAAAVLEALKTGASLRKSAEGAGVAPSTVLEWVYSRSDYAEQYASARAIGYDVEFEDLDGIAAEAPPVTASGASDAGWVAWKRLQIDTKKWALSKKQPKKYGDKVQVEHQGGVRIARDMTDDELAGIAAGSGG